MQQQNFETELFYDFDASLADFEAGCLNYDVLVDNDNNEVHQHDKQYQHWKDGKTQLYNNMITVIIISNSAVNRTKNESNSALIMFGCGSVKKKEAAIGIKISPAVVAK